MDSTTQRSLKKGTDEESASRMTAPASATDAQSSAADPGMKVDSVTIRRAANGGFIVNASQTSAKKSKNGPSYAPPKDLAFSSLEDVCDYLETEFGDGDDAGDGEDSGTDDTGSDSDY